ncbi:MAG: thioredoxin fold domain-containing protein [Candidatus Marinimicrobia bacterium]|nr:thioredoxin fold domain-containing protein [Candidatus Neomarinimicrobiota bacterium]
MSYFRIGVIISLMAACGVRDSLDWQAGSFARVADGAGDKMIMLDFYTDRCMWCKRLDAVTFIDPGVIAYANEKLVSLRVDAEKGEDVDLANKYNVRNYPSVVFTRPDGTEIDRIIGYLPPEDFMAEVKRIDSGEKTLENMFQQVADNPHNVAAFIQLGWKLDKAKFYSLGFQVWYSVKLLSRPGMDNYALGEFKTAEARAVMDSTTAALDKYLANNPSGAYEVEALRGITWIHRANRDTVAEAESFQRYIRRAVQSGDATSALLNGYGWRMTQLGLNLEDALEHTRLGISIVPLDEVETLAGIMDTEAELLWKLGKIREAVEIIDKCIDMQPGDEYFHNQKSKFLASLETA